MNKKVLVVGSYSYYTPHASFGEYADNIKLLDKDPSSIRLVVFIGGADVDPSLYGEKAHPLTYASKDCDRRDLHAFKLAQKNNIPCAGICRGGQFLTVMAGGKLIQHVSGHTMTHSMTTKYGSTMRVTSTHHQMFGWPLPENAVLVGWAAEKYAKKAYEREKLYTGSSRLFRVDDEVKEKADYDEILSSWYALKSQRFVNSAYEPAGVEPDFEPEVVYYPNINSLATQFHPEMMDKSSDGYRFYVEQVEKLLGDKNF